MYNVFDIVKKDSNKFLFLGKYKIFKNNSLIENYRNCDTDSYVYVKISNIPKVDNNTIIFDDIYMFKLLKNKMKNVETIKRLPIRLYDSVNLEFRDKRFIARRKLNLVDENDVRLLDSINEDNYIQIIKLIKNTNNMFLRFNYDKRTKAYYNEINYFDKVYRFKFGNDDFVFNILDPLINSIINNNEYDYSVDKTNLDIESSDSYSISISNFQEEIVLYLMSKLKIGENNKLLWIN